MAITHYYVDPADGDDTTGDGSIGTPWKSVQHALDNITQGTNGDQINIKAGTDDVLTASLSLSTYGTPTSNVPLIFCGYTSTKYDGGIGGISGGGSYSLFESSIDSISLINLRLHNSGSNAVLNFDNSNRVIGCEIYNATGNGIVADQTLYVLNCYIHDVTGTGIYFDTGYVARNYIVADTKGIEVNSALSVIDSNIIVCGSSGNGIDGKGGVICNNSIYAESGTGNGLYSLSSGGLNFDNVIEGFSGAGGEGIQSTSSTYPSVLFNNAVYNNTTNISGTDESSYHSYGIGNEVLSSSPFAKVGGATFLNRFNYFRPLRTGNVIGGAYPTGGA